MKPKLIILVVIIFLLVPGILWLINRGSSFTSLEGPAPELNLSRLDGGTIELSSYKGSKPVILDFWASWCPNCQRDMPKLSQWYRQYGDQVEIIGVNMSESPAVAQSFVTSRNISFPIVLDPTGSVSRLFSIRYTNTHVLIDINGDIVKTIPGDLREADIVSLIEF